MLRRALFLGFMFAGSLICFAPALGDEDMRVAEKFLQGLRDHQLYDIASDYLEQLRADPETPADLKATIDYRQGRIMLEEASKTGDLVRRKELLDQARGKIATFVEKSPKNPRVPEASMTLGRLLVERGQLAMKEADLVEAQASFDQARAAYNMAEKLLEARFKTFPLFISAGDPRKEERDKTYVDRMDAQLQKAIVDYEYGQTYEVGSEERKDFLSKGVVQFEELYKRYRTQRAGLTARMWQARCYEERGDLADIGKARGIRKELQPPPR